MAGVNKEACDAHGGTWCPTKANCGVLQGCLADLVEEARSEKRFAFEQHLLSAPKIEDPENREQCQMTRMYFGFDENFINDRQICEDVEQLRFAKDFEFLNEFFNQGSDVAAGGGSGDVPALNLIPPDRSKQNACYIDAQPLCMPRISQAEFAIYNRRFGRSSRTRTRCLGRLYIRSEYSERGARICPGTPERPSLSLRPALRISECL